MVYRNRNRNTIEKCTETETVIWWRTGLYIKYETMRLVNMLEDSGTYIKNHGFNQNICIEKKSKHIHNI